MKKETKDTVDISIVGLILILVAISVAACALLLATPFFVNWLVGVIITALKLTIL